MSTAPTATPAKSTSRFNRIFDSIKKPAGESSKYPIYKVKDDGKAHIVRIMPGEYGPERYSWHVPVVQHWFPNPQSNRGFSKSAYCKKNQSLGGQEVGQPCPFCEAYDRLKEEEQEINTQIMEYGTTSKDPEAVRLKGELARIKAQIKAMSYRTTFLVNLLDREDGDKEKIHFMAQTTFDAVLRGYSSVLEDAKSELKSDPKMKDVVAGMDSDEDLSQQAWEYCDPFDARRGYDVELTRTTEKGQTKYGAVIARRPKPAVDRSLLPEVLKRLPNLEELVQEEMDKELFTDLQTYCEHALAEATKKKLSDVREDSSDDLDFRRERPAKRESREGDERRRHDDSDDTRSSRGARDHGHSRDYEDEEDSGEEKVSEADQEYIDPSPPRETRSESRPEKGGSSRSRAGRFEL